MRDGEQALARCSASFTTHALEKERRKRWARLGVMQTSTMPSLHSPFLLFLLLLLVLLHVQPSHSPDASLDKFCATAAAAGGVAGMGELAPLGQQVQQAACAHLRARSSVRLRQWDSKLEDSLGSSITTIQSWLAREPVIKPMGPGWQALEQWLSAVAEELSALELKALLAPILERRWVTAVKAGVLSGINVRHDAGPGPQGSRTSLLSEFASQALAANIHAGRVQQAEKFYELMHSYEEGPGNYPLRWFYDTDMYHTSAQPWPGLRMLNSPDPSAVLPANTAETLVWAIRGMDVDASSAFLANGSEHKEIVSMYTAAGGWGDICKATGSVAAVCATLQNIFSGKMYTETGPIARVVQQGILGADVESVSLVKISSARSVRSLGPLGSQQDLRVNVLAPLCTGTLSISLAGSSPVTVPAYSLFAFEDRAEFEIESSGSGGEGSACVALVVGVLHPDAVESLTNEAFPSPHQVLRYALTGANRSHTEPLLPWQEFSKTMTSALVLASYYGYSGAVAALIDGGAPLDALHAGNTGAVHAACLGVTNVGDRTQRHSDRVKNALEILKLLADRGADLALTGQHGTPEQLAKRLRVPELSTGIAELMKRDTGINSRKGRKQQRGGGSRKARTTSKQDL